MADELKLTDREIAIAQGNDPDKIGTAVDAAQDSAVGGVEENREKEVAEVAKDGQTSGQPGTEANSAKADGGGTDAASQAGSKSSWLNDQHREMARSYGLADDDIKDFTSEAELNRSLRLIDRQLANAGNAAKQGTPTGQQPPSQTEQPAATPEKKKLTKLDLAKLKEQGFDDETLSIVATQNEAIDVAEQLEQKVGMLEQGFGQFQRVMAEQNHARHISSFHDAVDGLGDDRFGKSLGTDGRPTQLSKEQDDHRRKLYEAAETLTAGILTRARMAGQQPQLPPDAVLLRRAHQLVFADDIRAEERRKVQQDVTQQSMRRRPVSASRAPNGQFVSQKPGLASPMEQAQEIANRPDIVSAWEKMQTANGAR